MATKIMIIDRTGTRYLFLANGEIQINNEPKGRGVLVTPVEKIALRGNAVFTLGNQKFQTAQITGAVIDD